MNTMLDSIIARARTSLAKKQSEATFEQFHREHGPQAEHHTRTLYSQTTLIPLEKIVPDPTFKNVRLTIDPCKLADLQTSIELDGLRVPITVIEASVYSEQPLYYVRAGFRRTLAVRNLGWSEIPAIILPADMPRSEEYWVNILENTSREKLSSYEIACAAKKMRDEFAVSGKEFAKKTGHSPNHVYELLSCIDRLPPEVLQSWKNGDRIPFDIYFKLSCMTPLEAIKNLRLWKGQHRIVDAERESRESLQRLQAKTRATNKLWTVRGYERTQRLLMALKVSRLPDEQKRLGLEIIEYCQGSRRRVSGVVDEGKRLPIQDLAAPTDDDLELELVTRLPPLEDDRLEKLEDDVSRESDDQENDRRTP